MNGKPAQAVLVHRMHGRARLHVQAADPETDTATLLRLGQALSEYPGVHEARANPRAGSILLLHSGELDPILEDARARGLLELSVSAPRTPMRALRRAIDQLDDRVMAGTEQSVGLGGVAFVALAAAGIWQAMNGRLLPAGATLFNYALGVMEWAAEREPPTSEVKRD
jgi:hypothetical protein